VGIFVRAVMMVPWLTDDTPFPPVSRALAEPNGLLAVGGDLSADRLLSAYSRGIFPWYATGQPIMWWSPDPRMVLEIDEFKPARSLRKRLRQKWFDVRSNTAFETVIQACAEMPRRGQYGTWITPQMKAAYSALHRDGYAHSIETWRNGNLVGGLYGVLLDRVFFGESMFALETDASKVALATLVGLLRVLRVKLIDCQQETAHLASLGAKAIARNHFAERLGNLINSTTPCSEWPRGALLHHP
jgi:leucyl/phenylalanyl-tRNA---protein transferase